MCLPQEVVHELDAWSPMMPPPMWATSSGVYHWHPPVMDHARVTGGDSPGRHGSSGSFYDPDLYTFYPGVSRRSANEAPGSVFRSSSSQSGSKHLSPGSLAVLNPKLRPMTRQTTYKGKVMRGGGLAKRTSSGVYRSGRAEGEGGVKHDKTFNYIDMLRSLGQSDSTHTTPPRPLQAVRASVPASTSLLHSPSSSVDSVSEHGTSSDDEKSADLNSTQMKQKGGSFEIFGHTALALSPPSSVFLDSSSPYRNQKYFAQPQPQRPLREVSASSTPSAPSMSPFSYTSVKPSLTSQTPPRPTPIANTSSSGKGGWEHAVIDPPETDAEREEREMVMRFIADRSLEIVVLVEGNDATTGGVVQARHSYTGEDILWNTSFVPCVLQDETTGGAVIDYSLFHHTEHTLAAAAGVPNDIEEAAEAASSTTQRRAPFADILGSGGSNKSSKVHSDGIAIPKGSERGYRQSYQGADSWYRSSPPRHTYGSVEPLTPEERDRISIV